MIFNWFKRSSDENIDRIFLAGWEARFNGDGKCINFIKTQIIDKDTALNISSATELVFKNKKLYKAYDYDEGYREEKQLDKSEIGLNFIEFRSNKIHNINRSHFYESYLGGRCPNEFKIPKFDFIAPFQYIGMISEREEIFSWLPFDLHLTAPIYLNFDELFVDYEDPTNPRVFDVEKLKNTTNSYEEELKSNSVVIFDKVKIAFEEGKSYNSDIGYAGVPNWIQHPDIPICPKSNKVMTFVCQVSSFCDVKTVETNVTSKSDWMMRYFNHLNFWGDGDLFVFMEPESKMVCYIIQNT